MNRQQMVRAHAADPSPVRVHRRADRWLRVLHRVSMLLCAVFACVTGAALAQGARAPVQPGSGFWEQIRQDDLGAVRFELGRGVDPNLQHPEHGPAIVHAARSKAFEVTRQLARMRVIQVDAPAPGGETALMLTALHGDVPTMEQLLKRGAQVNRPGWSPLHYAATGGHLGAIRFLIEHHAFIDAESPNGTTPLMMAARMKQPQAARLLVELGADPTMRNEAGFDAAAYLQTIGLLSEAAWMREQALQYLLRYGSVEQARRAREAATAGPGSTAAPGQSSPAATPPRPAADSPFGVVPIEREVLPERPASPVRR
ncbi:MAG: hypothetical protein RL322_1398 [Pseudomonadota bacterium]